jgi:hypothetical protein
MEEKTVFDFIKAEENNWKTVRIPLTSSKDWNMYEHIERCTNVANAWYHTGKNDGLRPYDDIVTPIINVAFRTEGFDAKDIVPFVDDVQKSYMSFIIKKYHPQWSRKHELDTIIDDLVETSIIYDLALVKNYNNDVPEVIDLRTIAFCDQTDVLKGPLCLRHYYSISELVEMKGKWNGDKIDEAIILSEESKKVKLANDQTAKTPGKYIEVYELRGNLPKKWIDESADPYEYQNQMQVVCFYTDSENQRQGITLFKGKDKPLTKNFKALKIDRIRSRGRACGRSIVESLFEPQVWNNYSAIKIKQLLDSAINVLISDSEEIGGQKLADLKHNTVLKVEKGSVTQRLDGTLQNLPQFTQYQDRNVANARIIGSAGEAQLGSNPVSGTPFALQQAVIQQGEGIHEYRQGKVSTFFADQLYRDWILQMMVADLNTGKTFSEELTLDEMMEIGETIAKNKVEEKLKEVIFNGGVITQEMKDTLISQEMEEFKKGGNRKFMQIIKGELDKIPLNVMVNIKGKQRAMAQNADKITNILREIMKNPQAFQQKGIGKAVNQLLEESGMNPIDFSGVTAAQPSPMQPAQPQAQAVNQ